MLCGEVLAVCSDIHTKHINTLCEHRRRTACTVSVPVQYIYTSTTPMGRTACTEPQYLQYSYTSTLPMGRTACTETLCPYSTTKPLLPLWALRPVQSLIACAVQL